MPWQKWFLKHALELSDEIGNDGFPLFRFRKVVLLVGRQNGKSTVMQALTLWRMFVDRCNLVIGTAQDLEIAETLWEEAIEMASEVPELAEEIADVKRGGGKKLLKLSTGETYKVKAASRRGGRGLSGELVLLDEIREHQSWDAWGAVTKTTNARERAQIYAISNAGDATSVVLRHLRKMAHLPLGDPDGINAADDPEAALDPDEAEELDLVEDDSLGIFEYSAAPGCDLLDHDGLRFSNPALGYRLRYSTLQSDAATDPEWVYRTECLCQWSDGSLEGPFPPGAWDGCLDDESQIAGDVKACVATSWNRSTTYVAFAGRREDNRIHVEVVAARSGNEWVLDWLRERRESAGITEIAVQARGAPESVLIEDMGDLPVTQWGGADLGISTGLLYDAVRDRELRHRSQPLLDIAAATAVPRMLSDGAFVWDLKKSSTDAAPLKAVTGAAWLVARSKRQEVEVWGFWE